MNQPDYKKLLGKLMIAVGVNCRPCLAKEASIWSGWEIQKIDKCNDCKFLSVKENAIQIAASMKKSDVAGGIMHLKTSTTVRYATRFKRRLSWRRLARGCV